MYVLCFFKSRWWKPSKTIKRRREKKSMHNTQMTWDRKTVKSRSSSSEMFIRIPLVTYTNLSKMYSWETFTMLVPINKKFLSKRWCCFLILFCLFFSFFFSLFYFVRPRKDRVCFNYLPYQMILIILRS